MDTVATALLQQRIRVRGAVQGVGFRPYVYRLATELALAGWVRNDGAGVEILLRGSALALARFAARLAAEAPPLARIDSVHTDDAAPAIDGDAGFHIAASRHGAVTTGITADAATCADCVAELFDPAGRRWRYPFINCTHCGPRFTITAQLPYDRPQTSMAPFAMCPQCQREYDDVRDRRFHAQPNACAACGPRLALLDAAGAPLAAADAAGQDDVIAAALAWLERGAIVALKGLGGFQLVCDARNAAVVARLRLRKQRDEKPLAVMVASTASLAGLVALDGESGALLQSAARPIVLLPKSGACDAQLPGVAPGLAELGVMLPTTPLHWLLFHQAAGRPHGIGWTRAPQPLVLVMTSANPGGEPLVIDNAEALARLGGIADVFVMHDRAVLVRCDDSVVRRVAAEPPVPPPAARAARATAGRTIHAAAPGASGAAAQLAPAPGAAQAAAASPASVAFQFIRRARGYTPAPIALAARFAACPPVLATGAFLKNTACLTRGGQALLSPHIGDLDNAPSCRALEEAVAHLQRVLAIRPQAVAHDLHPDFFSTQLALRLAELWGVPALGVQHHHAHIAAVLAEHRHDGPALGLALDGVGLGEDGTAWGGELLRVDGAQCVRRGHLRALPLAGGDRAAREPWRVAAGALHLLGRTDQITTRFADQAAAAAVRQMLERNLRCPPATSTGRWFDAASGLLGVRHVMHFEGQAAMQLEALAAQHGPVAAERSLFAIAPDGTLDLLPLLDSLADESDRARGAARFHATLAGALAHWTQAAAARECIDTVALGGGCFLNALLSQQVRQQLAAAGLRVLQARQAPPNDGGLSLGQAWVALHLLEGDK